MLSQISTMKDFKSFLSEGITPSGLPKAAALITAYLSKKLSVGMFNFPESEEYQGGSGHGFGIRFFIPAGNRSLRINWSSPNAIGMTNIESADIWLDSPNALHFRFDHEVSLAQTLPVIADILTGKNKGNVLMTPPAGIDINEAAIPFLSEAAFCSLITEASDPSAAFDDVLQIIQNPGFKRSDIYGRHKSVGTAIFGELQVQFPQYLVKSGISFAWKGDKKAAQEIAQSKGKILTAIGCSGAVISKGASEAYPDRAIDSKQAEFERLPYEKQLEDLEHLIRMTISGSANALFIAGRGGIGKTHTVEKVLASLGLRDNAGYFKNTGTASAAGLYALLFANKDGIVLFDDSDDALKDQEARNIFKAATDTKKIRKLVWNKRGANVVDPGGEMSDEEILDGGLIPRWFEFTGKIIFISNLSLEKLDPDGAIRTRAYLIDINPTDDEVYAFMEKIVDDIPLQAGLTLSHGERVKVVSIIKGGNSKQTANLRKLSRGLNMYAAGGSSMSDAELRRMVACYA